MSAMNAFDGLHFQAISVLWILVGGVVGVLSGAISGMIIGGKALGDYKLAAMMGGLYAAMPVIPGIIIGTIIMALV